MKEREGSEWCPGSLKTRGMHLRVKKEKRRSGTRLENSRNSVTWSQIISYPGGTDPRLAVTVIRCVPGRFRLFCPLIVSAWLDGSVTIAGAHLKFTPFISTFPPPPLPPTDMLLWCPLATVVVGDQREEPANVLLCLTTAVAPPSFPYSFLLCCSARIALDAALVLWTSMHCWQVQGVPELVPTGQDWDLGMDPAMRGYARSIRRRMRRFLWLCRLVWDIPSKSTT